MKTFISYSSTDGQFVERLATDLRVKESIDAWLDKWEIQGGDLFPEKLEQALQETSVLVLILSPSSIESRWVQYERFSWLDLQLEAEKQAKIEGRVVSQRLIPVLYRNCQKPIFLRPIQHVAITDEHYDVGFKQLADAILNRSSKPPLGGQSSPVTSTMSTPSPLAVAMQGVKPRKLAFTMLKYMLPPQFEEVLFLYEVPDHLLSTEVAPAKRATEVIQYAIQQEGESLANLISTIYEAAPHFRTPS